MTIKFDTGNEMNYRMNKWTWSRDVYLTFFFFLTKCLCFLDDCMQFTSYYRISAGCIGCQQLISLCKQSTAGVDRKKKNLNFLMGLSHEWLSAVFFFFFTSLFTEGWLLHPGSVVTKSWEPQGVDAPLSRGLFALPYRAQRQELVISTWIVYLNSSDFSESAVTNVELFS